MVTCRLEWDIDLINDIFDVRNANLILSITLGTNEADIWLWNKEKLGVIQCRVHMLHFMIVTHRTMVRLIQAYGRRYGI